MLKGYIFNIERFALHDGPGIRTHVFMKGCPLKCQWCCNPESQSSLPELFFSKNSCIGFKNCGLCMEVCSNQAIYKIEDNIVVNRSACTICGKCADICPSKALEIIGTYKTVDEVMGTVMEDLPFYQRSQGGITLGGGEPLFQCDFVAALLKKCKSYGLNTALETSGYSSWKSLNKIARYSDTILYDIKHMDPDIHKAGTGVSNDTILDNLIRLGKEFPSLPVVVRTPVIPNYNSTENDIREISKFICNLKNVKEYILLPIHHLGESKYKALGKYYPFNTKISVHSSLMARLKKETKIEK